MRSASSSTAPGSVHVTSAASPRKALFELKCPDASLGVIGNGLEIPAACNRTRVTTPTGVCVVRPEHMRLCARAAPRTVTVSVLPPPEIAMLPEPPSHGRCVMPCVSVQALSVWPEAQRVAAHSGGCSYRWAERGTRPPASPATTPERGWGCGDGDKAGLGLPEHMRLCARAAPRTVTVSVLPPPERNVLVLSHGGIQVSWSRSALNRVANVARIRWGC